MVSKSLGMGILLLTANFFKASYLVLMVFTSSFIRLISSCIVSMSRHSCVFSVSSSSFCSIRFIRHEAAYPRFLRVRLLCFIRTISSRDNPRNFSCLFKSLTEMLTSSSSEMSNIGAGDKGGWNGFVYVCDRCITFVLLTKFLRSVFRDSCGIFWLVISWKHTINHARYGFQKLQVIWLEIDVVWVWRFY